MTANWQGGNVISPKKNQQGQADHDVEVPYQKQAVEDPPTGRDNAQSNRMAQGAGKGAAIPQRSQEKSQKREDLHGQDDQGKGQRPIKQIPRLVAQGAYTKTIIANHSRPN